MYYDCRAGRRLACEQQTHFRSSLLSLRKRSDDRKCVCCSQASRRHHLQDLPKPETAHEKPLAPRVTRGLISDKAGKAGKRIGKSHSQLATPKEDSLTLILLATQAIIIENQRCSLNFIRLLRVVITLSVTSPLRGENDLYSKQSDEFQATKVVSSDLFCAAMVY